MQNVFECSYCLPKDFDNFEHTHTHTHTHTRLANETRPASSELFYSDRKQGGISEISRKNTHSSNIQEIIIIIIIILNYLLTPWSRVLLDKLIG